MTASVPYATALIDHGTAPTDAGYEYALLLPALAAQRKCAVSGEHHRAGRWSCDADDVMVTLAGDTTRVDVTCRDGASRDLTMTAIG